MSSPTLPTTQRAAILTGAYGAHHDISSIWPVPEPLPDEVLIRISASGICSGDINPRDGYPPAGPVPNRPLVTGHEGLGYIVGVGSDSHDTLVNRFKIGDRVGMGWRRQTCHVCTLCRNGRENLCQKAKVNGYDGNGTHQRIFCTWSHSTAA